MQEHASLQNSSTENTLPPISTNSPRKSDTGQLPPAAHQQLIAVTKRSSFLKNEPNLGVKIQRKETGPQPAAVFAGRGVPLAAASPRALPLHAAAAADQRPSNCSIKSYLRIRSSSILAQHVHLCGAEARLRSRRAAHLFRRRPRWPARSGLPLQRLRRRQRELDGCY